MLMRSLALAGLVIALPVLAQQPPAPVPAPAPVNAKILHVDLRDVVTSVKAVDFPEAHLVVESFRKEPHRWWPSGVNFDRAVYGAELSAMPEKEGEATVLKVNAFMQHAPGKFGFRKFKILVDAVQKKVLPSEIVERMIPLQDMNFTITVSLIDRLVYLEDAAHDVRKLYPTGVGGFDMGIKTRGRNKLVTPVFTGAYLSKANTNPARTEPEYYKGKPFIALANSKRQRTAYAFHTTMGDTERVGGREVERMRGFWSHGCMRLRDQNLKELFNIVWFGGKEIPVTVGKAPATTFDHPNMRVETRYKTVFNCGTRSNPTWCKDEDGLTKMVMVTGKPPIEALNALVPEGHPDSLFLNGDQMDISEMELMTGESVATMPLDSNPAFEWDPSGDLYR